MHILLNGESRSVEENLSLAQLISDLQLKPEQIAIELNREVIRRAKWPKTELREGDKVEVVHFVGGGGA